ncbi:general substrate transporter [Meira miltonrushii]|uniref:General substrate transporter n=1 Tax=Meira miltonrushii TaxID=1280837 RepID=A0A316VE86_9BASI|nr:general substrate transporter [Meira miltonrushii]PWN35820.1 general substrate transporter [Meira miltonrushii]
MNQSNDELADLAAGGGYTPYLGRLTAVACLLGLQFGWDTGIAAGMLVAIRDDLGHPLSAGEQEVIVSSTTVGAIFGALCAGRLSDWIGRKKVMVIAGVLFAIGSIEQAASQVVRELVLGRFLVGGGVGMASMIVPTYLAECAPPSIRGRIIAINSILITGGQVIAYSVDAAFYSLPHGWRWMVLAGGIPAIIQLIGLFYLDESPRWLISKGKHVRARHVLTRIYPLASNQAIDLHITKIEESLNQRSTVSQDRNVQSDTSKSNDFQAQWKLLWSEKSNRKALFLACGLQAGQQLIGANSILYYSSRLLLMAGFNANPNFAAIWVALANFIGTVIALRLVDSIGRRKLLLRATAAATVSLAFLAISLGQIDTGSVTDQAGTPPPTANPSAWAYISLIAMVFFLFFYALGIGIVPWLVQSEIFSGSARGVGGGLATATNWSMNLLTSATFLDLVRLITPQGSFWLYTVVGALTWTFAYTYLPELKGISINDVQAALDSDDPFRSQDGARGDYAALNRQDDRDEEDDAFDGREDTSL